MLRKKNNVKLDEFKKFGFKYGTRDRLIYTTKANGLESKIYIDLLPCNNNGNEIKIENDSHSISKKIIDKLYDLIQAGLVEKV